MTQPLIEYVSTEQVAEQTAGAAGLSGVEEFARVRNLEYVFSPCELYPLAPHSRPPLEHIAAFAVDMDGTSTTTEPLALHALEYMVRRCTNCLTNAEWSGLDPVLDYPHVIGNSNFRHTEFLLDRYGEKIDRAAFRKAFFESLIWTMANMDDAQRRREVANNARNCGLGELLADAEFVKIAGETGVAETNVAELVTPLLERYGDAFDPSHAGAMTAAALDIYYARYHAILKMIQAGRGEGLSRELLGEAGRRLVEPMPGYAVFVPLIKGWLGEDAGALYEPLREYLLSHAGDRFDVADLDRFRPRLSRLGRYFERHPARLGLVTASISYETHAVMKEVVRVMVEEVSGWPLSTERLELLAEKLSDYRAVFDAFVNASDAHEARLKPHRDLYSIALFRMSVPRAEYRYCVGIEDTEPGIVSLRAAGIGCAIALPNHDTNRQDYRAATKLSLVACRN